MALALTIAAVSKQLKAGTLRITQTANGRSTAAFTIDSIDGTYRPAQDAEVIITEDGSRIFGGLVEKPRERGLAGGKGVASISTPLSAVDFHAYTERRYINEIFPEQTLAARLASILTYLTGYGVTLSGSQVTGPTLATVEYKYRRADEVLNETMTLTADAGQPYLWRIDAFKVLSAYQPSTNAAPFNITGDPIAQVIGDVEIEQTREHYANRIIVKVPSRTELEHVESFTGDGTTTAFTPTDGWTVLRSYGYITQDGTNYETLGPPGDPDNPTWTYDPEANTLTRNDGAPVAGAVVTFRFDGEFSGEGIAQDATEIAAHGIWERVFLVESVPVNETAQSLAEAYLAKAIYPTKTAHYKTLYPGVLPGQSQTITVARRNVNATGTITEVDIRDVGRDVGTNTLERTVKVVIDAAQTNLDRGWRDVYKLWAGDKTGRGTVTPPTTAATVNNVGSPAPPLRSVQFNNNNRFGGDVELRWWREYLTLLLGRNHTAGGEINLLVGEGHRVLGDAELNAQMQTSAIAGTAVDAGAVDLGGMAGMAAPPF